MKLEQLEHEYVIKFYLNARHYIVYNGKKGETHPHTWEFTLKIKYHRDSFTEFNTFENGINKYLDIYQNKVMNDIPPFDTIIPTLENMADYFSKEFSNIISDIGGRLASVEASETPTRTYAVNTENINTQKSQFNKDLAIKNLVSRYIDLILIDA